MNEADEPCDSEQELSDSEDESSNSDEEPSEDEEATCCKKSKKNPDWIARFLCGLGLCF